MAKKTQFVCSNCGHTEPKWLGRCPDCGEWSTFVEEMHNDKKAVGFAARAANAKAPKQTAGATVALREVVVVDSIQTLYSPELTGAPGGVGQVRETAARLMRLAKAEGIAIALVGHVTKEGSIAGPRVLEQMVDTVLQFEGDRYQSFRVLRALKNRFGSTNEVGVFEMTGAGMVEVEDPSAFFLSKREEEVPPGVVTVCLLEGTRPMLVEIESLVAPSPLAVPRRVTNGIEAGRVNMLCAVLGRRAGGVLGDQDVYVNVAGGVRVEEPAADLGVALAIASALRDRTVGAGGGGFGGGGVTGGVRFVSGAPR